MASKVDVEPLPGDDWGWERHPVTLLSLVRQQSCREVTGVMHMLNQDLYSATPTKSQTMTSSSTNFIDHNGYQSPFGVNQDFQPTTPTAPFNFLFLVVRGGMRF